MYVSKLDLIFAISAIAIFNILIPLSLFLTEFPNQTIAGYLIYFALGLVMLFIFRLMWKLAVRLFGEFKWRK